MDKKNPRKENEEKFIANNIDVINKHFKSDPRHTIKVKLANNVYVLDIDAHEGSIFNNEQIDILESHFAGLGFLTDRTPKGVHLFFLSDKPLCQNKISRVCSLGFSCEMFPPNSLINCYKPIIRSGIPTLGDELSLEILGKNNCTMEVLTSGFRHDGIKSGLVKFKPHFSLHNLFNQLWCNPPLEDDEFQELSLWCKSIPEDEGKQETQFSMEVLMTDFTNTFKIKYLFCPSKKQWLAREDNLRPVYTVIQEEVFKKLIFDHFQSQGRFFPANKIKQLVEQLVLVLQVNELVTEKIHCFQNGVFFSKDKTFLEFSHERLKNVVLSSIIPLDYSSEVRDIPEIWKDFLKKMLKWETVKAEDILAVIIAQTMGLVDLQAIYYLGGAPRSGKSLVMRLITALFGTNVAFFTCIKFNE